MRSTLLVAIVFLAVVNLALVGAVLTWYRQPPDESNLNCRDAISDAMVKYKDYDSVVLEALLWQAAMDEPTSHSQNSLLKALLAHQCRLEGLLMRIASSVETEPGPRDEEPRTERLPDFDVAKLAPRCRVADPLSNDELSHPCHVMAEPPGAEDATG